MLSVRRLSLWVPPLVYMVLIFHFSSESDPLPQLTANVWDKALHTIEYAGLALLFARALLGEGFSLAIAVGLAIAGASLYAGTDEFHQLFVAGRTADLHDWAADTVGAAVGATAFAGVTTRLPRRRRPAPAYAAAGSPGAQSASRPAASGRPQP